MGKNEIDIAKSRAERDKVRALLGCIPESILLHDKSDVAMDLMVEEHGRDYTSTFHQPKERATEFGKVSQAERNEAVYALSGSGARWGALSRFPQNIGRILLKLYTRAGQTVVDPFAGHNSRMEFCYRAHRNYIGCDISHKFMEANFKLRDMLLAETAADMYGDNKATITLHECDSRKMEPVKNNCGDFTITSPPYWDLEYYGDEIEQLGKGNEYHVFLDNLLAVAKSNFRCLRSGAFCVWCVNDFRKDGRFYPYHIHTHNVLREAGFKLHDTAIIDLGTSMRAAFASQIISQRILPKRHEYALIFVKP